MHHKTFVLHKMW